MAVPAVPAGTSTRNMAVPAGLAGTCTPYMAVPAELAGTDTPYKESVDPAAARVEVASAVPTAGLNTDTVRMDKTAGGTIAPAPADCLFVTGDRPAWSNSAACQRHIVIPVAVAPRDMANPRSLHGAPSWSPAKAFHSWLF